MADPNALLDFPKSKTLPARKFVKITTPEELEIALGMSTCHSCP